jgi:para-aminobenzoate synthetase / 4-amino-4-deoxychorismate lyase
MVSTVRADLATGMGAMEMVRALFPCGSITGAPKIRAMELIDQVERDARGPYCGAIGRIDPAGKPRSTSPSARSA